MTCHNQTFVLSLQSDMEQTNQPYEFLMEVAILNKIFQMMLHVKSAVIH